MTDDPDNFTLDETLEHLAQRFAWRAENIYRGSSRENSSPLYEHLSRNVAQDQDILFLVRNADRSTQIANLLFAAVHYLLIEGAEAPLSQFYSSLSPVPGPPQEAYPTFRDFCLRNAGEIEQLVTTRRVQTNEVQRCTGLLPAFHLLASRANDPSLAFIEIGCSAGLNLLWDRYQYDYGPAGRFGQDGSEVYLPCEVGDNGYLPLLNTLPPVSYRAGIDINPIDVHDARAIRWMRALIWPEHTDRAERLMQAVEIARRNPPNLIAGNAIDLLPGVFSSVLSTSPQATLCIYHSYTLNQCSQETRNQFEEMFVELSTERDYYRVSLEWYSGQEHPCLQLYFYRNQEMQVEHLAYCESHGRWIEWIHH